MTQQPPVSAHTTLHADVARNLRTVRHSIEEAAQRVGRDPRDIRLIAVSKTMSREAIEAALDAGHNEFGENTIQDALTKIPYLQDRRPTWHFVGHLQSNKAKFIPGNFAWVHSIDRLSLAQKLSSLCEHAGARLNVLIQVNVTSDPNKHGVAPASAYELVEQILAADLSAISLRGLMTMGPYPAGECALRNCFAHLRALRDKCIERFGLTAFSELSMGMTDDFWIAIAEGATMVRIGAAIFGPRPVRRP